MLSFIPYELDKNPSGGYLVLTAMVLMLGGNGVITRLLRYRSKNLLSTNETIQKLLIRMGALETKVDLLKDQLEEERKIHIEELTRWRRICSKLRSQLETAQKRIAELLAENESLRGMKKD